MKATNLRIIGKYPDGAYRCLIDLDYEDETPIEESIYNARHSDKSPLNIWICERIDALLAAGEVVPDWIDPPPPAVELKSLQTTGTQTL